MELSSTKTQRSNHTFTITFCIHYYAPYGKSIFAVGNIAELGFWNVQHAFRLTWTMGHEWKGTLILPNRMREETIAFKYVVADTDLKERSDIGDVRWEIGPNREINLNDFAKKKAIVLKDTWEFRRFVLRFKHDILDPDKVVCVYGKTPELGSISKIPRKMEMVIKKDPITAERAIFWQIIFNIPVTQTFLRYRFMIFDMKSQECFWEREPDRFCHLTTLQTNHHFVYSSKINRKLCLLFEERKNQYKKIDTHFVADFALNQIDDKVYIGPYPQHPKEVGFIAQLNIHAVLSLQTGDDMANRGTSWNQIKARYNEKGIKAINFPMYDNNAEDIAKKAWSAANLLNQMIEKWGSVYVHCTAGVGRAPHTVVFYYHFFKRMSLEDAMNYVKKKRPVANLSEMIVREGVREAGPLGSPSSQSFPFIEVSSNSQRAKARKPARYRKLSSYGTDSSLDEVLNREEEEATRTTSIIRKARTHTA